MKLSFFSEKFVARLRDTAASNVSRYGADGVWLDEFARGERYVHESNHVVAPPPSLVVSGDLARDDAENSIRVFEWLKELTPAIAMEERLWAQLTHGVFADYMRARWPVDNEKAVRRRYLFEGHSFASLARNGVSRLWWAGYLTCDRQRPEPYELTKMLFMRQDIQVSLLERAIGKCHVVRTGVLEFLRDNSAWLSEKSFGRRIQILLKELNLLGGVAMLDALPPSEIHHFLKRVGDRLVKESAVATS